MTRLRAANTDTSADADKRPGAPRPREATLQRVPMIARGLDEYRGIVPAPLIEEAQDLAADLRGVRIVQVNSTAMGGGVAEILQSLIPLELGLGLDVQWRILCPDDALFDVTKRLHNALQGRRDPLSAHDLSVYEEHNAHCGPMLGSEFDIALIHDPQPAALRLAAPQAARQWIWRCHIDTGDPEPAAWSYLHQILTSFDRVVVTLPAFIPPDMDVPVEVIAPAIDPLSPKNVDLPAQLADSIATRFGLDPSRPLVVQVARFDPWKDPLGVIDAFRRVHSVWPDAQLALVGALATDDPEGWEILRAVESHAKLTPGVRVLSNLDGVGAHEVNALQRAADVAVQKSIREGFGLTVSEALWKGTPVVGGRAGGIPLQLGQDSPLLVDSVDDCAERVIDLLADKTLRAQCGRAGRERVRERFLIVRLLRDELRVLHELSGHRARAA